MKKIYIKPSMEALVVECEIIAVSTWEVDDEPITGPVGAPQKHIPFGVDDDNDDNPNLWEQGW